MLQNIAIILKRKETETVEYAKGLIDLNLSVQFKSFQYNIARVLKGVLQKLLASHSRLRAA